MQLGYRTNTKSKLAYKLHVNVPETISKKCKTHNPVTEKSLFQELAIEKSLFKWLVHYDRNRTVLE